MPASFDGAAVLETVGLLGVNICVSFSVPLPGTMYEADIGAGANEESSMGCSSLNSDDIAAGACDSDGSFGSAASGWAASMELFLTASVLAD